MSRTPDAAVSGSVLEDDALAGGSDPIVRFEGVGMRYGRSPEVLQDISFELAPGSFHFLTGPSGAGKSSLLKLIYLAHRPSRGRVSLFSRDVLGVERKEAHRLRRRIGVVFRADVVRLWPRAAGAYAAVRLPVNPVGLTIEDVHAQPSLQDGHPALIVSGQVRNIRPVALASPPLKVVLRDKDGHQLLVRTASPPDGTVPPGQSRRFSLNLVDPPAGAVAADIDFAQIRARTVPAMASRAPIGAAPEPQAMTLRLTGAEDARPIPPGSPYALPATVQPGN